MGSEYYGSAGVGAFQECGCATDVPLAYEREVRLVCVCMCMYAYIYELILWLGHAKNVDVPQMCPWLMKEK